MSDCANIAYCEQIFRSDAGETLRPDLVAVSDDTKVRYEEEGVLAAAVSEKIEKCESLRDAVTRLRPEDGDVIVIL
jgi:hypothetical protein